MFGVNQELAKVTVDTETGFGINLEQVRELEARTRDWPGTAAVQIVTETKTVDDRVERISTGLRATCSRSEIVDYRVGHL